MNKNRIDGIWKNAKRILNKNKKHLIGINIHTTKIPITLENGLEVTFSFVKPTELKK